MVYVGYFQVVQHRRPCPANIRLGEDVLKTSSVWHFFVFQDVLKTSWRHNCKTSCKHVLKMSWRRLEDVLKTSSRHFRKTYSKYVLKKSWRRLGRRKVLRWRRLQDFFKTSWKTGNVCWVCSCWNLNYYWLLFTRIQLKKQNIIHFVLSPLNILHTPPNTVHFNPLDTFSSNLQ